MEMGEWMQAWHAKNLEEGRRIEKELEEAGVLAYGGNAVELVLVMPNGALLRIDAEHYGDGALVINGVECDAIFDP